MLEESFDASHPECWQFRDDRLRERNFRRFTTQWVNTSRIESGMTWSDVRGDRQWQPHDAQIPLYVPTFEVYWSDELYFCTKLLSFEIGQSCE